MIKYLIMDVDGTLTDGKIYMGESGELFKAFNIKDGCSIKDILPDYGIIPIVTTSRQSRILENRCRELAITRLHQNVRAKLEKLKEILTDFDKGSNTECGLENCAYIGDDILDIECMQAIKEAGGVVGCPADAAKRVKDISDFVSGYNGGEGAVREFIEWLVQ